MYIIKRRFHYHKNSSFLDMEADQFLSDNPFGNL
jgi:hypothetical protein